MTKTELEFFTVAELKAMAKEKGVKSYSRLRKAEIIEAIIEHEENQNVIVEELESIFDSRKSFYKKAHVITQGEQKSLRSYDTIVCIIKGKQATITGTYSQTTVRHINEFLAQNGFKRGSKKELEKMYM